MSALSSPERVSIAAEMYVVPEDVAGATGTRIAELLQREGVCFNAGDSALRTVTRYGVDGADIDFMPIAMYRVMTVMT